MYDDKPQNKQKAGIVISPPPSRCSVNGCGCDTDVNIIMVRDGAGIERAGVLMNFGFSDKEGNYYLHNQYTFLAWVTRCANHYTGDLIKAGKDQLRVSGEDTHTYMLSKPHNERMVVLRNIAGKCLKTLPYDKDNYADEEREAIQSE